MAPRLWDHFSRIAERLPAVLVLLALTGVGVVGYLNDWKLPRAFGGGSPAEGRRRPRPKTPRTTHRRRSGRSG